MASQKHVRRFKVLSALGLWQCHDSGPLASSWLTRKNTGSRTSRIGGGAFAGFVTPRNREEETDIRNVSSGYKLCHLRVSFVSENHMGVCHTV